MQAIASEEARQLIREGRAPANLQVRGRLDLANWPIEELPTGLQVDTLDLSDNRVLRTLPPELQVRRLTLNRCTGLTGLPAGLACFELEMRETAITALPDDLQVEYRLDLNDSRALVSLPGGLRVGALSLRNCTVLRALPDDLEVYALDISGCRKLTGLPAAPIKGLGRLTARACLGLTGWPAWMAQMQLWQLDVSGCANLRTLPDGLRASWIDVADTGIHALPPSLQNALLRWRGVEVEARVVFHPETITAREVLAESNAEKRRILLERMGTGAFLAQANPQILHRDTDKGGPRQLLRLPLRGDEDLVCLAVRCPSTGREYMIRVPPAMRTCHQAAAWIAGFDNPRDYHPIMET